MLRVYYPEGLVSNTEVIYLTNLISGNVHVSLFPQNTISGLSEEVNSVSCQLVCAQAAFYRTSLSRADAEPFLKYHRNLSQINISRMQSAL